jgi:hypothetical protein
MVISFVLGGISVPASKGGGKRGHSRKAIQNSKGQDS